MSSSIRTPNLWNLETKEKKSFLYVVFVLKTHFSTTRLKKLSTPELRFSGSFNKYVRHWGRGGVSGVSVTAIVFPLYSRIIWIKIKYFTSYWCALYRMCPFQPFHNYATVSQRRIPHTPSVCTPHTLRNTPLGLGIMCTGGMSGGNLLIRKED